MDERIITWLEATLLLAIALERENAFGYTIHERAQKLAGDQRVSYGSLYPTLQRLEEAGLVSSFMSEPRDARGGRSRRHYKVENAGIVALHRFREFNARITAAAAQFAPGVA
jgi:DNA-binding PadR family transcriptional regulator